LWFRRQRANSHSLEACFGEPALDRRGGEAEPDVAHLALVLDALVLDHVDRDEASARSQHAGGLAEHLGRLGDMVQDEAHRRGVERAVVDRQGLELAAPEVDVS
jgi:hypothetical protein